MNIYGKEKEKENQNGKAQISFKLIDNIQEVPCSLIKYLSYKSVSYIDLLDAHRTEGVIQYYLERLASRVRNEARINIGRFESNDQDYIQKMAGQTTGYIMDKLSALPLEKLKTYDIENQDYKDYISQCVQYDRGTA